MNRQPYCTPPRWWEPRLSPRWVKFTQKYRWKKLRRSQRLMQIDTTGLEHVQQAIADGKGVLITPNHSAHYDSAALYVALDRINQPVYFMTAWQAFAMSGRFERWFMQKVGCFSIDRESTDRQAMKQAVHVLQNERHPLVIFPEGDIYHTTDFVTPFRDGAAAIALLAAKRGERPVVIIPCGIKFWYIDDPTEQLLEVMQQLEQRLYLRTQADQPLPVRIHRLAEAALALKELDYLGRTREGRIRDRIVFLSDAVLTKLEQRHDVPNKGGTAPERVKALRQCVIHKLEDQQDPPTEANGRLPQLALDMEDLFFVMQLFSYRGDYLADNPSIERLAETVDKFEEDILGLDLPQVRGRRRVTIHFGPPIEATIPESRRDGAAQLTHLIQDKVQQIIDGLNIQRPDFPSSDCE
jgi:hypothetical protein